MGECGMCELSSHCKEAHAAMRSLLTNSPAKPRAKLWLIELQSVVCLLDVPGRGIPSKASVAVGESAGGLRQGRKASLLLLLWGESY